MKMAIPRNVGAHNPTKIPNRSAWALSSEVVPLFIYQIEIDPTTDIRLKTNVIIDSVFIFYLCIETYIMNWGKPAP